MRQLKGKPKKESWKDKKERKQAMQEAREQVATVVLPTLVVLVLLIVLFVYVATRPTGDLEWSAATLLPFEPWPPSCTLLYHYCQLACAGITESFLQLKPNQPNILDIINI